MKKSRIITVSIIIAIISSAAFAIKTDDGNKLTGKHYTLNILGKAWDDKAPLEDCDQGNRIFVNLGQSKNPHGKEVGKASSESQTDIYLTKSLDDTFQVLDCDGTDGEASFMLPDPNGDGSGCTTKYSTRYTVVVRALGGPANSANMNLCATYVDEEGDEWTGCGDDVYLLRDKGKVQKFEDVTKELLTICVCTDYNDVTEVCDGDYERKFLFDDGLEGQYWKYENDGLRHAQIRFYWEPSCLDEDDWSCD